MHFCVGKRRTQISEKRAHMHFKWPAWDKTQSRLALFANLFCVASVLRQFETSARLEFVVLCPVDGVIEEARTRKATTASSLA